MQAHLSVVDEAAFAAFVQLIIYVIGSRQRWRRFMFLVFLVLAVIAGRWLLANRWCHVLLHHLGPAAITRSHHRSR